MVFWFTRRYEGAIRDLIMITLKFTGVTMWSRKAKLDYYPLEFYGHSWTKPNVRITAESEVIFGSTVSPKRGARILVHRH